MEHKPKVFVITPFNEDFLALYDHLKEMFKESFDFTNAGDLDNQQNIMKDIVCGIHQADVIIADLTGLNANVFYELGLSHAMNKKVIIITQNIGDLPFDIRSYRANEYSLQFNKLPKLIDELKKLLDGAINDDIKYGNPVSDYIPNFYKYESGISTTNNMEIGVNEDTDNPNTNCEDEEDGFLDYLTNIDENSKKLTSEFTSIANEINIMNTSINSASSELNRVKSKSGNIDANFARNVCRKLSNPVSEFSEKLKSHVNEISEYWNVVENCYLSLLDNQHTQKPEKIEDIQNSMLALDEVKQSINNSDPKVENFIIILDGSMGIERRLNKAISSLIHELERYLQMTETMISSIDRIHSKGNLVISALKEK